MTRRDYIETLADRLLEKADLPMPAFLAGAATLKSTVTADPAESVFSLADKAQTIVLETLGRPKPRDSRVTAALAMLESAVANGKRLKGKEIAANKGMDAAHLSRLVHAESGFHLTEWRTGYLLRPSLTALAETKEHVKQIACGLLHFNHQGQFDKEFERLFGLTPTEFRRLAQTRPFQSS
ncbi:MAG: helix-turn-helix domain-containing protein [Vicinamibacterales bacterium]